MFQPSVRNAVVRKSAISPETEEPTTNTDRAVKKNKIRHRYVYHISINRGTSDIFLLLTSNLIGIYSIKNMILRINPIFSSDLIL